MFEAMGREPERRGLCRIGAGARLLLQFPFQDLVDVPFHLRQVGLAVGGAMRSVSA